MSIEILQADAKAAVAKLASLSNDELDEIMNSDEKIEEILKELEQSYLKEIENEKETIMASNHSLAEYNLSKEPELVELREKVQELSEQGEELTKSVDENMKIIKEKGGDMSLETALALLRTAASEMEEESDKIAQKFLDNETDLDDFLEQFLVKRKLMHTRLVKAEKLSKLLQRDPSLSNIPNYINSPPLNINTNYIPGVPPVSPPAMHQGVPYPTGPFNMPMPPAMNYFQNHY
ncbi:unnamed protein product [Acanthoscelides obtectus]|uniref:VPS37 C-terminal domain-containing protein n=1 Tax=Acanthoscelides obtectus TaxID=200917 RepID=A0A9P0JSX3_ACAOB|nr:unnamed protein product [Acanthoscelides obtectus]CAK1662149.1 Vacuolar protein sorting-associated protein 37B [Acanthoscelides obtectus]